MSSSINSSSSGGNTINIDEASGSNSSTTTSNTICCKIHPSIQSKRRRRCTTNNNNIKEGSNDDNEWIQLMKECPLCLADDDDSVWSERTSSGSGSGSYKSSSSSRGSRSTSSSSSKTLRSSPKSSNDKQQVYNSAPVNTPSPPPTAPRQLLRKRLSTTTTTITTTNNEYIPSKFKESKDYESEVDNGEDECQIEELSLSNKNTNYSQDSQKDNKKNEYSINLFPSLPFTDQDNTTTTTASNSSSSIINERTSSIKQLIQHRKNKLEELKLLSISNTSNSRGRLTPPSQRYMNSKMSTVDLLGKEHVLVSDKKNRSSNSVKSLKSFCSESTKHIPNSTTAITVRKDHTANEDTNEEDTITKPSLLSSSSNKNMLETSFYSNVSHSFGSPQKDKLTLTMIPKLHSRCHSDSTLSGSVSTTTNGNTANSSTSLKSVKRDRQQQKQQQQKSHYNKSSILDISYDSFVDESVRQFLNYHNHTTNEGSSAMKEEDDSSIVMKEEDRSSSSSSSINDMKEEEDGSSVTKGEEKDTTTEGGDYDNDTTVPKVVVKQQVTKEGTKKSHFTIKSQQPHQHQQQHHKVKRKEKGSMDLLNTATYDIWGSSSSSNNMKKMEVSQATATTTKAHDDKYPSSKQDTASKSLSSNMNDMNKDLQSMNIEEEDEDVSNSDVSPTLSSIHDNNTRDEDDDDNDSYDNNDDGYSISDESLLGEEPPGYTSVNNMLKRYDDYNNEVSSSYTQDNPPGDNMSSTSDYYMRSPGVVSATSSSDSYSLGFDDYAINNPRGGVSNDSMLSISQSTTTFSQESSNDESRSRSSHLDERRRERSRNNHPNPSILRNRIPSKSRSSSNSKESSKANKETTRRRSNRTGGSSIAKSKSSSKSSSGNSTVTQESVKTFCQYDARTGRCIHHPNVQLRRKRRLGGFKKGQWKIISMNCTECAFEEVQRLRARALKKKQQQQLKPCSSSVGQKSQYTSATESSSRYTSSDDLSSLRDGRIPKGILKKHPSGYYVDDSNSANGSITLPSISETQSYSTASESTSVSSSSSYTYPPWGILRKPNKHVVYDNESSFLSESTELSGLSESCYSDSTGSSSCVSSELTTEFSYLSSLSGTWSGSSCSTGSSDPYLSSNKYTRYPEGILRGSSRGSSKYSVSSRKSEGSRVVFAGRDIYY